MPVDEQHPIAPVDINGINKLAGEWYHIVYNNVYGVKSTVLRLTNTYGPRMRVKDARQTFLGIWIRRLIEGEPLIVYGDGKQIRDFNYIDDVTDAMLIAAISKDAEGEIFNLGADDPINLHNTAELLLQVNQSGSYEILPFPPERKVIDIGDYYGNFRKIQSRLGWKPKTSLKSGLEMTLAFYREFHSNYWESEDVA